MPAATVAPTGSAIVRNNLLVKLYTLHTQNNATAKAIRFVQDM